MLYRSNKPEKGISESWDLKPFFFVLQSIMRGRNRDKILTLKILLQPFWLLCSDVASPPPWIRIACCSMQHTGFSSLFFFFFLLLLYLLQQRSYCAKHDHGTSVSLNLPTELKKMKKKKWIPWHDWKIVRRMN